MFSNPSCNFPCDIFRIHPVVLWCFKHFETSNSFSYKLCFYIFTFCFRMFFIFTKLYSNWLEGWKNWLVTQSLWCCSKWFSFCMENYFKFHSPNFSIHWTVSLHPLISFGSKTSFCSVFRNATLWQHISNANISLSLLSRCAFKWKMCELWHQDPNQGHRGIWQSPRYRTDSWSRGRCRWSGHT